MSLSVVVSPRKAAGADGRISARSTHVGFFAYLGIAFFVLMAIAIPLGLVGPTRPDTKGYDSAVKAALKDADSNNSTAQGAPQQAVVNGWLARDLMEIQIKQNNDELVLLHLAVVVLIGALLTMSNCGLCGGAGKGPDGAADRYVGISTYELLIS